jgi:ATP-dependent protease ClpP protease subunit
LPGGKKKLQGKPEKTKLSLKAPSTGQQGRLVEQEDIELGAANTVIFRAVVNAFSVAMAQKELLEKSAKLSKGSPIYLVLDTPGGDIYAGSQLIDTAKSLRRPVHTITIFAASMGFNFVQRLGTRYVLPSGTLMAHRARVEGVGGQVPGEFLTAAAVIYEQTSKMERFNASRLGVSFEQYTDLVRDEYWVSGDEAVKQNAADKLAQIHCDESLSGTYTETAMSFFGPIKLTWAKCPAITAPLSAAAETAEGQAKLREYGKNFQLLREVLFK